MHLDADIGTSNEKETPANLPSNNSTGISSQTSSPSNTSDTQSETNDNNANASIGKIDFRFPQPAITGNVTFTSRAAEYDTFASNHWRIVSIHGFMTFRFKGNRSFSFHGLGSTKYGVSYCNINVYINGRKYWSNRHLGSNWQYYTIPATQFVPGSNTVKIELVGKTHMWIDEVCVN